MNKTVFLTLALFLSGAMAQANCLGEAQIIAKVDSEIHKSLSSCVVSVKEVSFYKYSGICPLDLVEVMNSGIEVGFKDGHDCRLQSNDPLTGEISVNQAGKIVLE